MADRSPGVTGAPDDQLARRIRSLREEVARLRRTRVTIGDLPLPVTMADWTFAEVDGHLQATNPLGAKLAGSGEPGPKGDTGENGLDGAPGLPGRSFLGGPAAPLSTDGVTGDFYVEETNHLLWGPKDASRGWVTQFPFSLDPVQSIPDIGWATAKISNSWYPMIPHSNSASLFHGTNLGFPSSGGIAFCPAVFPWRMSTTALKYRIQQATAGASARFGVYASSAVGLPTGAPTILNTDSLAATGERTVTFSSFTFERSRLYWVAMQVSSVSALQINGICIQAGGYADAYGAFNYPSPPNNSSVLSLFNTDAQVGGYAAGLPTNPTFVSGNSRTNISTGTDGTPLLLFRAA